MPDTPRRTLVTAALPYANGPLHLGHLAGCYLPADIYVRYLRQQGHEVLFVCGSDEHGAAITMKARKEGKTPGEIVDHYDALMKNAFADFGIAFDIYSRTSDRPRAGEPADVRAGLHRETAQEFFQKFIQSGDLEPRQTEQLFDPEAQVFLADRYVTGTCPVCSHPKAYGDQCENCGSTLSPDQLIDARSTLSGATPVKKQTTHWFLRLDRWQDTISNYIEGHPEWRANVLGQCRSWLNAKDGLQPRAMTRDLDWGIDVPVIEGHITAEQAAGKKLYVWFDAPIGYISATKEWAIREAEQGRGTPDAWKQWWQRDASKPESENTRLVHFIGKDNIVFHCILFPEMLQRHGAYVRADAVPANEFLNLEGDKLSTSRGWAVWLHDYLADPDLGQRTDELRYYLTAIAPETSDSNFSWKDFQTRINSELVATFSNYVHRTSTLIWKFYDGYVPIPDTIDNAAISDLEKPDIYYRSWMLSLELFKQKDALEHFMSLCRAGNTLLSSEEPWKLIKHNPEKTKSVMCLASHIMLALSKMCEVQFPSVSSKIKEVTNFNFPTSTWLIPSGHQLGKPEMLFTPISDEVIARQTARLEAIRAATTPPTLGGVAPIVIGAGEVDPTRASGATSPKVGEVNPPAASGATSPKVGEVNPLAASGATSPQVGEVNPPAAKAEIAFADFEKIDLRLGTVTAAARVPKADKLLQLTVSLGLDTRTIVSGIAQHYAPEALVGQRVMVVANLTPRTMRGVESRGMVLLAEGPDGRLVLVQPPPGAEGLPDGSVVR